MDRELYICPLRVIAKGGNDNDHDCHCIGTDCAWFYSEHLVDNFYSRQCAVLTLAEKIQSIDEGVWSRGN